MIEHDDHPRLSYIWPDGSDHIGHADCDPCRPLPADGGRAIRERLAARETELDGLIQRFMD